MKHATEVDFDEDTVCLNCRHYELVIRPFGADTLAAGVCNHPSKQRRERFEHVVSINDPEVMILNCRDHQPASMERKR